MNHVLFVSDNLNVIHRVYTKEQIGDAPVLTIAELRAGLASKETEYLFSTWACRC